MTSEITLFRRRQLFHTSTTSEFTQWPVDHRLRRQIRGAAQVPNQRYCDHEWILADLPRRIYHEKNITGPEIQFAQDLAAPATTGGILILVERPSNGHKYGARFDTIIENCATLKAVNELLQIVSGGACNIRNTSVFDFMPFINEGSERDTDKNREIAQQACWAMIEEKKPDIVLCCSGEMQEELVPELEEYRGNGRNQWFHVDLSGGLDTLGNNKLNVFRPSYAVDFQPTYSVFRDFFVLEFTHAIGLLRGDWKNENWMEDLRQEAMSQAELLLLYMDNGAAAHASHGIRRLAECQEMLRKTDLFHNPSGDVAAYRRTLVSVGFFRLRRQWLDVWLTLEWFEKELADPERRELAWITKPLTDLLVAVDAFNVTIKSKSSKSSVSHAVEARNNQLWTGLHTGFRNFSFHLNDVDKTNKIRHLSEARKAFGDFAHVLEGLLLRFALEPLESLNSDGDVEIFAHMASLNIRKSEWPATKSSLSWGTK